MVELAKNNNLISSQVTNELKKHFDKFIKIAEADCLICKDEFNELEIEKQVETINKLIDELGTIKKACEYIGISKSTIRDRFKTKNYYYDQEDKKYKILENSIDVKEVVKILNFLNNNSKKLLVNEELVEKNKKIEKENISLEIENTKLKEMIQNLNLHIDSMRGQIISSLAEVDLWKQKYKDINIILNDKKTTKKRSKLSCRQIEEIKKYRKEKKTIKELCEMFECSETLIRKVLLK